MRARLGDFRALHVRLLSGLALAVAGAVLASMWAPAGASVGVAASELGGQVLYAERCASCHAAATNAGSQGPVVVLATHTSPAGPPPTLSATQIVLIVNYLRARDGVMRRSPAVRAKRAAAAPRGRAIEAGDCEACHAAAVQAAGPFRASRPALTTNARVRGAAG